MRSLLPLFLLIFSSTLFGQTAGDYRSKTSGAWNVAANWEIYDAVLGWIAASTSPSSANNVISVQAGHQMDITSSVTIDQTVIEASGIINYTTGGSLTIANGTGDDLTIFGTFKHNLSAGAPYAAPAVIRVKTGGTLEVNNNGTSASHYGSSVQIFYEDGATYYWNVSSGALFSTSGITYFPNAGASEIAVFRTNCPSIAVGAGSTTTINGLFQVDANTITWQNSGTKVFRDGIAGAGNIAQAPNSGQLQITGSAATISGAGALTLNTNGMSVTSASTTTLTSAKTINNTSGTGTFTVNGILDCGTNAINGTTLFTLASGGTLRMGSPNGIASSGASGNIQSTGTRTFNAAGNYEYNGSSTQSTGSGLPTTINAPGSLIVNNGSGVNLSATTTINGGLTFNAGLLTLGALNLTLGSAVSISGVSTSSYVKTNSTGSVSRVVGGSNVLFPVGNTSYNPATLNNGGTSDTYTVRVLDDVFQNGLSGPVFTDGVVDRTWNIQETVAGGSNLTLTTQWSGSEELGTFDGTQCYISNYLGVWQGTTPSAAGGPDGNGLYSQTRSGLTTVGQFAVASNGVLPVELALFQANKQATTVLLSWSTATESQNNYFAIERASNGRDFTEIGRVAGAGDSREPRQYSFTDASPLRGTNFYRLRQVDHNGASAFSPVVSVQMGADSHVRLFPAQTQGQVTLLIDEPAPQTMPFRVFDLHGRMVLNGQMETETTQTTFQTANLPAGRYLVRLDNTTLSFFKN